MNFLNFISKNLFTPNLEVPVYINFRIIENKIHINQAKREKDRNVNWRAFKSPEVLHYDVDFFVYSVCC